MYNNNKLFKRIINYYLMINYANDYLSLNLNYELDDRYHDNVTIWSMDEKHKYVYRRLSIEQVVGWYCKKYQHHILSDIALLLEVDPSQLMHSFLFTYTRNNSEIINGKSVNLFRYLLQRFFDDVITDPLKNYDFTDIYLHILILTDDEIRLYD